MARVVFGVVGAVIGYFAGGNVSLGYSIGSTIGQTFEPNKRVEGPKLTDLRAQVPGYGQPIPKIIGASRVDGFIIWQSTRKESQVESGGGKGGGGGVVNVDYVYSMDLLVGFCEGEIAKFKKLWANGILIYDATELKATDDRIIDQDNLRFYDGNETQLPDPMYQAAVGIGNASAHRGTAYIAIEGLQLSKFGNNPPIFSAEILTDAVVVDPGIDAVKLLSGDYLACPFPWVAYNQVTGQLIGSAEDATGGGNYINQLSTYNATTGAFIANITSYPSAFRAKAAAYSIDVIGSGSYPPSPMPQNVDLNTGYLYDNVTQNLVKVRLSDGAYLGRIGSNWELPQINQINGDLWVRWRLDNDVMIHVNQTTGAATSTFDFSGVNDSAGIAFQSVVFSDAATGWLASGGTLQNLNLSTGGYFSVGGISEITGTSAVAYHPPAGNIWLCRLGALVLFNIESNIFTPVYLPSFGSIYETAVFYADVEKGFLYYVNDNGEPGLSHDQRIYVYDVIALKSVGFVSLGDQYVYSMDVSGPIAYAIVESQEADYYRLYTVSATAGIVTATPVPLQTAVIQLAVEGGLQLSQIDTSDLTGKFVKGYSRTRQMSARAAIEPLMQAYYFDAFESELKVKFRSRGGAVNITIGSDDYIVDSEEDPPIKLTRGQELELPRQLELVYFNENRAYDISVETVRRAGGNANEVSRFELPIILNSAEAKGIAYANLMAQWVGRDAYSFKLSHEHSKLEPGDILSVSFASQFKRLITQSVDANGPVIEVQAVADDESIYTQSAEGSESAYTAPTLNRVIDTNIIIIDSPALRDQDDGYPLYIAVGGASPGPWGGASLLMSRDSGGTYTNQRNVVKPATTGFTLSALPSYKGNLFDRVGTVDVRVNGVLNSVSELACLAGANGALVGNEIIQFVTATLIAPSTYRLSNLLRSRKGTDDALPSNGQAVFVYLGSGIQKIDYAAGDVGKEFLYKAVSAYQQVSSAVPHTALYTGRARKPYSVCNVQISRDVSGNITLTWKRRARVNVEWRDFIDVPLDESTELYEVDILNPSTYVVVRTMASGSPTISYLAATQTSDGLALNTPIPFRIYQVSPEVGRGIQRLETL